MQKTARYSSWLLASIVVFVSPVQAKSVDTPPPLPAPTGPVVSVATVAALESAVASVPSNTTILIAPGTYRLTHTLWINRAVTNVTIRGATDNRDDVVIVGDGMGVPSATTPFGIWTGNGVSAITIANLTIRSVYQHALTFNGGTTAPHVYNVRLADVGEQLLKANPDSPGHGVDRGVVEYSVFEYTTSAPTDYTNGVDVIAGQDWIVRDNLFRRIRTNVGLAGPAVLFWKGAAGTVVERNTFIDCHREINLGLDDTTPSDHAGGVVRNNFIARAPGMGGDVGIGVFDSPGTIVAHNTIVLRGAYPNAIEYRFAGAINVQILNNLTDGGVMRAREGASAQLAGNVTTALPNWFVDPVHGDLHLTTNAIGVVDLAVATADAAGDWDGGGRPSGAGSDVGADERESAAPAARDVLDIDGDHRGDVLLHGVNSGAWSVHLASDGASPSVAGMWPAGWTATHARFDDDTRSDVFLFDAGSGRWAAMRAAGATFGSVATGTWGTGWQRFVVDLDGDGDTDVFLWDRATGAWFQCLFTGNGFDYVPGFWSPGWEVMPARFDADARQDFFLSNPESGQWFVVLGAASAAFTYPVSGFWSTGWTIVPGDFSGDGVTDLLLRIVSSGYWILATAGPQGFSYTAGFFSPGWTFLPLDLDGNGKLDLLLHDRVSGQWFECLSTGAGWAIAGNGFWSPGWQVRATDFNGDGRADVLLYNGATGQWYRGVNLAIGSFQYESGWWSPGLEVTTE